jgi:hypothetical protein
MFACALPLHEAFALEVSEPVQITFNTVEDMEPRMDGTAVVWIRCTTGCAGTDVIERIGDVETPLTSNPGVFKLGPDASSDRRVWIADNEIVVYENGTPTVITNDGESKNDAVISGAYVVWEQGDDVYLWDGSQITNLSNSGDTGEPSIDGDLVAWENDSIPDGMDDIFIYRISTDTLTQLTNSSADDGNPKVSNEQVAFDRFDGNDTEIMLWDGADFTQLTDNSVDEDVEDFRESLVLVEQWNGLSMTLLLLDTLTLELVTVDTDTSDASLGRDLVTYQKWDGNDYELFQVTVIPEPSCQQMLTAGVTLLLLLARRRRR